MNTSQKILSFWRDVEFFVPFDLSTVLDQNRKVIEIKLDSETLLPWQDPNFYELKPDKEYAFDFYFAPFPVNALKSCLADKFTELRYGRGVKPLDFYCSGQTDVSELMAKWVTKVENF